MDATPSPARGSGPVAGLTVAAIGYLWIALTGTFTVVGGMLLGIGVGLFVAAAGAALGLRAAAPWLMGAGLALSWLSSAALFAFGIAFGGAGVWVPGSLLLLAGYGAGALAVVPMRTGWRPSWALAMGLCTAGFGWFCVVALWTYQYQFLPPQLTMGAGLALAAGARLPTQAPADGQQA